MLKNLGFVVLLLVFSQISYGQIVRVGRCPKVASLQTFDWERYVGTWYEYARYPLATEFPRKCQTTQFTKVGNHTILLRHTSVSRANGEVTFMDGRGNILGPGSMAVVFFEGQSERQPNYRVIETDYENYAVVYSCRKIPFARIEYLWILTRKRQPSFDTLDDVYDALRDHHLSTRLLWKTTQKHCPEISDDDVEEYFELSSK